MSRLIIEGGHRQVLKVQCAQLGAVTLNVAPMQANVLLPPALHCNFNQCCDYSLARCSPVMSIDSKNTINVSNKQTTQYQGRSTLAWIKCFHIAHRSI